jgi:tetratricopeptide (TPR) repeat protein
LSAAETEPDTVSAFGVSKGALMGLRRGLVLVFLGAVLAGVGAWRLGWLNPAPPAPPAAPRPSPTPSPPPFESPWATEQDWIVDTITRDVREMAHFAAIGSLPDDLGPAIRADALSLEPHIFSPVVYAPLAQEVRTAAGPASHPRSSDAGEDARLLNALLDLRPEVLVRESERVSRRLEAEPRDAAAHERAALILGAFALREGAGYYTDARPALCRMTAHLALARALRDGTSPGLAGRFDDALLDTHVGRQRDALARLDALEAAAESHAEKAWVRALRLRNTLDWRIARDARGLTLLEKLQEFLALAWSLDALEALAWLDGQGRPEPIADWGRIAMGANCSVECFNRFAPAAAVEEMREAAEVRGALGLEGFDDMDGFLESLNERPGPFLSRAAAGRVRGSVLRWGLWADRAQRHLIYVLVNESYHIGGALGRSGADKAFVEKARAFSSLALFPLFLRNVAVDAELYRRAMAAARELAIHSPERMTGGIWRLLLDKERYAPLPNDLPDAKTWFRPPLLAGTLLEYHQRVDVIFRIADLGPERVQELRELAPYRIGLAASVAKSLPPTRRTLTDLVPVYGPLGEFNVHAMTELAMAAWYDTAEFRRRQGALCELNPESCFRLGYRLAELGFDDEAAAAYQQGFDRARDRVWASQETQWLVSYYYAHGNVKKAETVAREAASTCSAAGLLVLANLMERLGNPDDAEDNYRHVYESYDQIIDLVGFYYRQARVAGKSAYEARLRTTLAQALPSGLEPFDRAALPPKPTDGVVVRSENDNTKRYQIKWGNVIVGLDGFRVRNTQAFAVVRALSYSPHMKLVIWRGTSYDDLDVELWDRRFRIDIDDLKSKDKPKER